MGPSVAYHNKCLKTGEGTAKSYQLSLTKHNHNNQNKTTSVTPAASGALKFSAFSNKTSRLRQWHSQPGFSSSCSQCPAEPGRSPADWPGSPPAPGPPAAPQRQECRICWLPGKSGQGSMSDWHQGLRKMFSVYALCMCACLCRCVCVCVCCVYVPASVGVGVCGCLCCYVCVLYMRACVLACVWNTTCMTSTKIFALTSSVSKALWVCMTNTNITYCTDLQCVGFISLCDHALTCSVSKALSVCVTMHWPPVCQRLYQSVWPCTDLQCVKDKGFINLSDHALTCSVSKALSICVTMHWPPVCRRLYQSVWPCTDLQCVKGFISLCDHALTSSVSKALSVCMTNTI